jgi:Kef-type K+ transport system membrane component KefB/Trk K+ transport system NAD-binding subunit
MLDLPTDLSLFWDIGLIIAAATLLGYLTRLLRQPIILAYVIAGLLIGPGGFKLITNQDVIRTLSEFGIAFLLFIVGLELDLRKLKTIGFQAILIGIVKSVILFGMAFIISNAFGFTGYAPIYLGLALAFSSTMIVVKMLSDKSELGTLHGRILVAILLTEDVLAILALSFLSTKGEISLEALMGSFGKGILLLAVTILASRLLFPRILRFVSKSPELLFLTALSICFVFAGMAQEFGFSIAIGSFLGGLAVASFPYNIEIISRVQSLRDFFSTIFFVSLGMGTGISFSTSLILPLLTFLFMVVVVKSVIVMIMLSTSGYSTRTSFLTSISLSQISEFSLIMVIQGLRLGHINQDIFSITVLLALITITITSYLIKFDEFLYRSLSRYFVMFERFRRQGKSALYESEPTHLSGRRKHVVVCGCHRMGYAIVKTLQKMDREILVIEFDPDIIQNLSNEGIPAIYGDIGNVEVLRRAKLEDADIVISTVPVLEDNLLLLEESKKINPRIIVIATASTIDHAIELYSAKADYVVLPKWLAGEKAAELIERYIKNPTEMSHAKRDHQYQIDQIKKEDFGRYEPSLVDHISKQLRRIYEEE